ncbi:MAG: helix-turn-helix domain-containing protein [Eubacterium ventriosum]
MAEKLSVSRQSVSKWESGQSVPDFKQNFGNGKNLALQLITY